MSAQTFACAFRSCAILKSRKASAANSRGRQPKDCVPMSGMSREAATDSSPNLLPPLRGSTRFVRVSSGLRPRLLASVASRLKKCATSKLALQASMFRWRPTTSQFFDFAGAIVIDGNVPAARHVLPSRQAFAGRSLFTRSISRARNRGIAGRCDRQPADLPLR